MSNIEHDTDIIDIEADTVEPSPVETKSPSGSWRSKLILSASAAVIGAVGGGWFYRDYLSSYLPSNQMQVLATRMDAVQANTTALGEQVKGVIGLTDEMKSQLAAAQISVAEVAILQSDSKTLKTSLVDLRKSLSDLSTSLESIKTQVAAGGGADASALAARFEALDKDVASLKQVDQVSTDTTLLSQNLADLKAKISAGTDYQNEIDRVALLVPAADGLDVLRAHAAKGLPNAAGLATELKEIAAKLPKTVPAAAPDDSWLGYAGSLFDGLVTIKTAGAEDWEQVALQAASLAEQGDLGAAASALKRLEGALPVELQDWHTRATARLEIEHAVEKTAAAVLRQIAAKG